MTTADYRAGPKATIMGFGGPQMTQKSAGRGTSRTRPSVPADTLTPCSLEVVDGSLHGRTGSLGLQQLGVTS